MFISKEKYNQLITEKEHYRQRLDDSFQQNKIIIKEHRAIESIIRKCIYTKDWDYFKGYFNYKGKEICVANSYQSLLEDMQDWDAFLDNTEALKKVKTK